MNNEKGLREVARFTLNLPDTTVCMVALSMDKDIPESEENLKWKKKIIKEMPAKDTCILFTSCSKIFTERKIKGFFSCFLCNASRRGVTPEIHRQFNLKASDLGFLYQEIENNDYFILKVNTSPELLLEVGGSVEEFLTEKVVKKRKKNQEEEKKPMQHEIITSGENTKGESDDASDIDDDVNEDVVEDEIVPEGLKENNPSDASLDNRAKKFRKKKGIKTDPIFLKKGETFDEKADKKSCDEAKTTDPIPTDPIPTAPATGLVNPTKCPHVSDKGTSIRKDLPSQEKVIFEKKKDEDQKEFYVLEVQTSAFLTSNKVERAQKAVEVLNQIFPRKIKLIQAD